mmetsp:Transcript_74079/g.130967  ORF Transcript_74079/g.130967 Transcript_74079/m.130967 type:complete len:360 (+) Transcript_74079:53-1132(+)|eukprot:CAMPEP_0197624564 /NCGR_PEP_ID=MMETSP1338-20131121/4152_1 /TAXON_ID=43686 ORGANISM="Pelagodinium beii, Strain RCC1491" /NCGR_SAMPLE_ID=MMETSP1338 /ASSEMBLY_ACC=CAM_ASM_000754 /LENGTH=359 /DNA_ID=CAMNT_0043194715 /DNA_START=51 /DNA_END=1130 /DNA_ORIENTATION=-
MMHPRSMAVLARSVPSLHAAPRKAAVQAPVSILAQQIKRSFADVTIKQPNEPRALSEVMPRDGSRTDLKILPMNPDYLRLPVPAISKMSTHDVDHFAFMLNTYGAVILVPEGDEDRLAPYKILDQLFGTVVHHDAANEHGIVEINPAKPTSINTANPKKEHLPHTDDAYTENPSMFCTLQCIEAAPSGGGETVLISGAELVASLSNKELKALMKPGMVSMGRRPAADGSWMKVSSIPMFWVDQNSGWLQVRWRCNDGCVGDVDMEARPAYEQMDAVARGEVHQLVVSLNQGELLVIDNRAIAHGRRSYEADEPRVMWRKNYVGDGQLAEQLKNGLCPSYSSMFDGMYSMFEPPLVDCKA